MPVAGEALLTDPASMMLQILSPKTRRDDEVQKFRDYLTIPTLGTSILAETESPFLTLQLPGEVIRIGASAEDATTGDGAKKLAFGGRLLKQSSGESSLRYARPSGI
jgi:hypothetical protein